MMFCVQCGSVNFIKQDPPICLTCGCMYQQPPNLFFDSVDSLNGIDDVERQHLRGVGEAILHQVREATENSMDRIEALCELLRGYLAGCGYSTEEIDATVAQIIPLARPFLMGESLKL